jgi:hypothetical protein
MPSLYGTSTTYTVTASNVSTLYFGSTSTAITATTYSTNLAGLYGGSYSALPTNAQQLIQLFDNSGNVDFYLNPSTNSSTIYANFMGTASITVGNFQLAGNTITNTVNGPINLYTNGDQWSFNTDGSTSFPNYTFPSGNGTAGQVLIDDGSGNLYWDTIAGGVTDLTPGTGIALSSNTGSITITNIGVVALTASSGIAVSTSTGSIAVTNIGVTALTATTNSGIAVSASTGSISITNIGVKSITAGTSTYVSTSTGDIIIWTTPAPAVSTAFDFGTILAPVSYTLDMGPIIV